MNKLHGYLVIMIVLLNRIVLELKKLHYILFAVFFTVLTVGASVSKHYSGGDLYSVALFGEAKSCCEVPCDCCDDESDVIQFTADYVFSISANLDHSITAIDLFTDYAPIILPYTESVNDNGRIIYRSDIHPPRETSTCLSQIQTYLL